MKLLGENILVRPTAVEKKAEGGLIIPDSFKEKPKGGIVLEVGTKVEGIVEGEFVMYDDSAAQHITIEDEELAIVKDQAIYAVL